MNESVYGIVNYAARYWFVALAFVIVYRAYVISVREYRIAGRIRQSIGLDGVPGRLILLKDPGNRYEEGYEFPVFVECTLGRGRGNDVSVRQKSIQRRHAKMELTAQGLRIRPEKNAHTAIEGVEIGGEGLLRDGEVLRLGDMDFRLSLTREDE